MKTDRPRHDTETNELFEQEAVLRKAFAAGAWGDVEKSLLRFRARLDSLREAGIANSRGLDHFLQVSMAWITTFLGWRAQDRCFRATVSLFLSKQGAILVKPCLVYPGECRTPQPSISTKEGYGGGAIGQTGLSMATGRILYCRRVPSFRRISEKVFRAEGTPETAESFCGQYIPLEERNTRAALCIPLRGSFEKLREDFTNVLRSAGTGVCSHAEECTLSNSSTNLNQDNTVLNVECTSDYLDRERALEILNDDAFSKVVDLMIETIGEYQERRNVHRALEYTSTLLALGTNTLTARPAYRALLREISTACDAADVTLHLKDLFDDDNVDRCSIFVTGVGANFRDFLINERIGLKSGQIGWALVEDGPLPSFVSPSSFDMEIQGDQCTEKVKIQLVMGEEIRRSLEGKLPNQVPFKQLMPKTFLNVTVPIYFHNLKVGVVNIEWDEKHLQRALEEADLAATKETPLTDQVRKYLGKCLPLVYRMADYLSLVVDYYDDLKFPAKPSRQNLSQEDYVKKLKEYADLRRVMRYYTRAAMRAADSVPEDKSLDKAEKECLRDLVDAVGYFLGQSSELRILVSVRRLIEYEPHPVLRAHVWHWVEAEDDNSNERREDIELLENVSVLATCAFHGIPLFGRIENGKRLLLDKLCKSLANDPHHEIHLGDSVPYRVAGTNARYEVGVPLIFGKRVFGTFDFEQFERKPTPAPTYPEGLEDRDLCVHLEWGRAITFLIAYLADARRLKDKNDARHSAFRRFQALCAQLIADVPVEEDQLVSIATDLFGEIIPITNAAIEELPLQTNKKHVDLLRFRGGIEAAISWAPSERGALVHPKSEIESGRTVTSMMASYFSLIRNLQEDPKDDEFTRAIRQVMRDLSTARADLLDQSRDAGGAALNVFSFLEKSLRRNLARLPIDNELEREASDYAWFLHVRQFSPEDAASILDCKIEITGEAQQVLAYCGTQEMKVIVEAVLPSGSEGRLTRDEALANLGEVLKERSSINGKDIGIVISDIKSYLPSKGVPTRQELIRALTLDLAHRKVDKPEKTTFTLSVARANDGRGAAIVVPEINLSPNRSERAHGWFWKEKYTVLGIPFRINNKCIAVLNIFRRRESSSDLRFFRVEERNEASKLSNAIDSLFKDMLEFETIRQVTPGDLKKSLEPLINNLVSRARGKQKLIVVQTPFATSRESFNDFCDVVFLDADTPAELKRPVHFPDDDLSHQKRTVVIRMSKRFSKLDDLARDIGLITKEADRVFLFTTRRANLMLDIGVPFYTGHVPFEWFDESLLEEPIDHEKLYYKWLLGKAIVGSDGGEEIMLARRGTAEDAWTLAAFWRWVVERREKAEHADLYATKDLSLRSSWRPDLNIFALKRWIEADEKGEQP